MKVRDDVNIAARYDPISHAMSFVAFLLRRAA